MPRLEVSPAADRDLDRLKRRIQRNEFGRLRAAIAALAQQPRPTGVRKIQGSDTLYRIRVGDYRIVYEISDKEELVVILQVSRCSETTYR